MLEMADLHIKSSFRNPKIFTDMILLAVEFSLYTNFVRGVALNANHLINLKPSPIDFWRNFLTFRHQKQVNRLKNTGVMKILTLARSSRKKVT